MLPLAALYRERVKAGIKTFSSGDRIRTSDLKVMSLASYQAALLWRWFKYLLYITRPGNNAQPDERALPPSAYCARSISCLKNSIKLFFLHTEGFCSRIAGFPLRSVTLGLYPTLPWWLRKTLVGVKWADSRVGGLVGMEPTFPEWRIFFLYIFDFGLESSDEAYDSAVSEKQVNSIALN